MKTTFLGLVLAGLAACTAATTTVTATASPVPTTAAPSPTTTSPTPEASPEPEPCVNLVKAAAYVKRGNHEMAMANIAMTAYNVDAVARHLKAASEAYWEVRQIFVDYPSVSVKAGKASYGMAKAAKAIAVYDTTESASWMRAVSGVLNRFPAALNEVEADIKACKP